MNKYIWVIEDGEYSDYHVVGVFSSRKNAELIQAQVGGTIEKWPLDPAVRELSQGYRVFLGEMLYDGTIERMVEHTISQSSIYSTGKDRLYVWYRSQALFYQGKGVQDCLHGTVLAKDRQHAIKIFNEKRTQLIALGQW